MRAKTAMGSITRPAGLILMGAQLSIAFSFFILTASNLAAAPLQALPPAVKPALPTLAPGAVTLWRVVPSWLPGSCILCGSFRRECLAVSRISATS